MTVEEKDFALATVLSVTTGRLLCDFGAMRECVEWIAGHPVWTHEMGHRASTEAWRNEVYAQHPTLAAIDSSDLDHLLDSLDPESACRAFVDAQARRLETSTVRLRRGVEDRTQSPIEVLAEMMPDRPVIVVAEETL